MRIAGVILAGGRGRRMGGADKALIPLRGRPLIAHAIARLSPQVTALAISANGDPARFAAFGLPVLADADPRGPLSGVLAGLGWAAGHDALVTVAVDTPFFPADLVARLAAAGAPAMAASRGDLHPTFALWPLTAAPALQAFLASGAHPRVTDFARSLHAATVAFDDGDFSNINTPDDLSAAGG
jgi:molybdopterin-guanine dinucleotide biosynthesis protein A